MRAESHHEHWVDWTVGIVVALLVAFVVIHQHLRRPVHRRRLFMIRLPSLTRNRRIDVESCLRAVRSVSDSLAVVETSMKLPQALSPLTDPRSLTSSVFFHAVLLLVASMAVLGVTMPRGTDAPQSLHGELEPTDNRAPVESSGGGPGELGGEGLVAVQPSADGRTPAGSASIQRPTPCSPKSCRHRSRPTPLSVPFPVLSRPAWEQFPQPVWVAAAGREEGREEESDQGSDRAPSSSAPAITRDPSPM